MFNCSISPEIVLNSGKVITYSLVNGTTRVYICLCTNNQWVNYKHLRPDDIRLEFVHNMYNADGALSEAEKLMDLLRK